MIVASLPLSISPALMSDVEWTPSSDALPLPAEVSTSEDESAQLMLRVKVGDERAFERLVELHQHAVIGTVTRMLGSAEDGHDVAQMVFIRVWKSAPRYEPTAKFTTWLYTIMRNLVFNEMRRRGRRKEVSLDEPVFEDQPRELADPAMLPADTLAERAELETALDKAIAALPEKQRMAVLLRRQQETPYEDLCGILGMSLPAVKSLLFRARAELRKHLAAYLGEDP
jgi:RNA polymerase sigma-70 factor (ECF subfamily)